MYRAMVGPALPISLPKPYQSIPIAMGIEVNPPRTGGKRRRRIEGAGGLVRGWLGSGIQAGGSWGCSSDIALLGFGGAKPSCTLPRATGIKN